jgi:hypothetical protein
MIIGDIYTINSIQFFSYKSNITNVIYRDIYVDLEKNIMTSLSQLVKDLGIQKCSQLKKHQLLHILNQYKNINGNQIIFQ